MGLHVNETLLNDSKYKKQAQRELKNFVNFINSIKEIKNSTSKASAYFDLISGRKDTVSYLNAKNEQITLSFKALKVDKVSTLNMTRGQLVEDLFTDFGNSVDEVNEKLGVYTEKQLEKSNYFINYTMMHGEVMASNKEVNTITDFTEEEIAENQKQIKENAFGKEFSSQRKVDETTVKTILTDVKSKSEEYNKIGFFRRALSYINPFKDSVREMRNDISETKKLLTENGIDKDELENFVSGKSDIDSIDLSNVEPEEEFDSRSTLGAQPTRFPLDDEVENTIGEKDGPQESEQFIETNKNVEVVLGDDVNLE